jgi:hypothetical protein
MTSAPVPRRRSMSASFLAACLGAIVGMVLGAFCWAVLT